MKDDYKNIYNINLSFMFLFVVPIRTAYMDNNPSFVLIVNACEIEYVK